MGFDPGSFIAVPQRFLLNSDLADLYRLGPRILFAVVVATALLCLGHLLLNAVGGLFGKGGRSRA